MSTEFQPSQSDQPQLQLHDTYNDNEGIYEYGVYYFISKETMYAVYIRNGNSSIVRLSPINRDGDHAITPENLNPFLVPISDEGSGTVTDTIFHDSSESQLYVYTVHHHHAYIAIGETVLELLLNADTPNFHRINIGHSPIQLVARDFGQETYLYILYEEDDRGYVAVYRKYSNRNWGKHGQNDLLVYSPRLFDLSLMSNVLFFSADDWHYSYKVTYVVIAVGYTIYFKEILDDFEFNINVPRPCDRIISLNFNEIKQTLFVVCTNVSFYFSYIEYQIYASSIWNRTGLTYFSQDGRIAAIATNHSGDMTTVTIHGLHFKEVQDKNEKVYEFQHFHHVASRSLIILGEFITVSSTQHYYCYIEVLEFGIICIDVEQALMNQRQEGTLNGATLVLPNTHSLTCSSYANCPVMYSHNGLFVVQVMVCDHDCESVVMLFNMSTLENIANITGVSLDMHAYKAHPHPIVISPSLNDSVVHENTTQPKPTHTNSPVQPLISIKNIPMQTPHTQPTSNTEVTTQTSDTRQELLDTCQSDLVAINTSYDQLLYITITLCVCFCVAMLVTILLLVLMICISRREKPNVCKECKK
jgi:hypothetical protein